MAEANPEEFEVHVLEPQGANQIELPSAASLQSRAMRLFEQERMRLRDTLSFERQHPPNSEMDGPFMPPVPESRDYTGIEERQREILRLRQVRQDLRRMARRHPAPTPPYTDRDAEYMVRSATGPDSPRLSMTPALSPMHQNSGDVESPPRRPLEASEFSFTARGLSSISDVSIQLFQCSEISQKDDTLFRPSFSQSDIHTDFCSNQAGPLSPREFNRQPGLQRISKDLAD